ncbi:hypothetical protein BDN70DRAFT_896937 [Pholiota conissans]|uniref:Yeast cell wall synthesis Kre9/Knh1-like N-terminal domain-containing protein n=1 Tax=Pholiota conissans TaxID=109636 RepID=A0A9P5YWC6_9AGAR|nr:hypothetical protein BDN70DRAFT_896937 [Pholiota conissans]
MFSKLSLLSLVLPLVSGLVLEIPKNPTTGGSVTIHWTNEQGDPSTWSFELINTAFNDAFAIANNVDPSPSALTLTLPIIPVGDGYTLQAVNIGNISDVFASTGDFAVGAATTSLSSTASTLGTSTSTKAGSVTSTGTTPTTALTTPTPGFSSVINSATTSTGTSTTSGATTSSSATTTAASTNFNAGLMLAKWVHLRPVFAYPFFFYYLLLCNIFFVVTMLFYPHCRFTFPLDPSARDTYDAICCHWNLAGSTSISDCHLTSDGTSGSSNGSTCSRILVATPSAPENFGKNIGEGDGYLYPQPRESLVSWAMGARERAGVADQASLVWVLWIDGSIERETSSSSGDPPSFLFR